MWAIKALLDSGPWIPRIASILGRASQKMTYNVLHLEKVHFEHYHVFDLPGIVLGTVVVNNY